MSKLASLKDLKSAKAEPEVKADSSAPEASVPTEAKPKRTPEELKELRKSNLKPKVKDPKKMAEDEKLRTAITQLLTDNPKGLTSTQLREAIFTATEDKTEQKNQEKKIRFMARAMNCLREDLENHRKLYLLPVA